MKKIKQRNSSIELYRIILMLLIIAHHYVVNSTIPTLIEQSNISIRNIYLLVFGAWGKVVINCFILITGYYMCKTKIRLERIFNFIIEVEFYKIIIYLIFLFFGREQLNISTIIKVVFPITNITDSFISGFICLLFLIPYINLMLEKLNTVQLRNLILTLLIFLTLLGTIPIFTVAINYIIWFVVVYLIGSYIRINKIDKKYSIKRYQFFFFISIIVSITTIILGYKVAQLKNISIITTAYYFLIDSNKVLAVIVSVSSFLLVLNIKIKYNKFINYIAKSVFGVLLIHANSNAMRSFLWGELLNLSSIFYSKYTYIHSILSILGIFIICIIIDKLRIQLFNLISKLISNTSFYVKYKKIASKTLQ